MSKLDDLKNEVAELEAQEASARRKAEAHPEQEAQITPNRGECIAIIRDEFGPMADRVAAAGLIKKIDPYLSQFADEEVVERLVPHPDVDRLRELKEFIVDCSAVADVEGYIQDRIAAIAEFNSLLAQYPKRTLNAPVLIDPEQRVAYHAASQDPKHGVSRDTYSYTLRRFGWKV